MWSHTDYLYEHKQKKWFRSIAHEKYVYALVLPYEKGKLFLPNGFALHEKQYFCLVKNAQLTPFIHMTQIRRESKLCFDAMEK